MNKASNVNRASVIPEFPGSTAQFWVVLSVSAEDVADNKGSVLAACPTKDEAQAIARMVNKAISNAVTTERERCAAVAERWANHFNSNVSGRTLSMDLADWGWAKRRDGAQAVADDIRGKKEGGR